MATNVLGGSGQGNTANPVDILSTDKNLPSDLRSQLNSLLIRIEELQMENEILHSRISRCQCSEVKETENFIYASANSEGTCLSTKSFKDQSMAESNFNTSLKNKSQFSSAKGKHDLHVEKFANSMSYGQAKQIGCQHVTMREYAKRHVALKIMYFGQRFYGFASEAQIEPTVESEIFKALERTKLLVGSRKDSHYSRCGRTDKGVSATGQVISLYLRSNGKGIGAEEDINYVMVLNRVLPKDIRVTGLSHVPLDFSARFSCLSREYRYLFWRESMDISIMQKAAKKFIGEHDFRNFCKMDAVNVSNYRRHITEFTISPCSISSNDDNLWAVTIKGSAFLWHQVRCMVSVLLMIGEGLESPHIIDVLLDINKTPRKPQYIMASEIPLVLHCCEFQGVNFICSSDAKQNLQQYLTNELRGYLLQAAIVEEALNCLQTPGVEGSSVDQHKKKGHISLTLRPTEPSYEERKAKWAMKPAYKRADL